MTRTKARRIARDLWRTCMTTGSYKEAKAQTQHDLALEDGVFALGGWRMISDAQVGDLPAMYWVFLDTVTDSLLELDALDADPA